VVIKFDHFRREAGFGFFKVKSCSNFNEVCRRKTSIVVIDNMDDSLCLARAFVVGMSKLNESREIFSKVRDGRRHEQAIRAITLCSKACVDLRNGGDRSCVQKF
jgi:hypothetical protein